MTNKTELMQALQQENEQLNSKIESIRKLHIETMEHNRTQYETLAIHAATLGNEITALNSKIELLKKAQQWISVDERLPDEGVTVLVVTNFDDIYTCRLPVIIAKNSKEESPEYKRERFTHWMVIPPAPEGDNK